MKDIECTEHSAVSLICKINKPNVPATWLKDGHLLTPEDNIQISVEDYRHTLSISDVTLDHEAEYTFTIMDKSSKATILVDGKNVDIIYKKKLYVHLKLFQTFIDHYFMVIILQNDCMPFYVIIADYTCNGMIPK